MVQNLIHLLLVAPLLYLLATDKMNQEQKQYVLWLTAAMVIYYLLRFFGAGGVEGMTNVCNTNVHAIRMLDSSPGYDRPCISVKKGDVVMWTNVGELRHGVTEKNSRFNSGYLYPGQSYSVRLDTPGVYDYYCMLHSGWMAGRITVV